ncbi:nucleoside triphosphate pyrophosphohydrolase [Desulfobotulus sp. H1]|uniref:Nucleoside triphosphate pyrophosphohydrolase n=1 Tax=Desulfobotulus pelophilus TaxID=2823377 RepID=A0ABT3N4W6_9BACT|nr:nucleoside triphosphate pyrophosphohydrolase [Desulfobotulus pelophilus]MCW7752488.1 nucleoside triphosphate pyrophosphohydrolase [Desulfobotulus pelophilus]
MKNELSDVWSAECSLVSLWQILKRLRGEGGCPWDQKQTPESMISYFFGESYELADAVDEGRPQEVCEELGDVLFQLLFIAFLYEEKGAFRLQDVLRAIETKLIRRHPHVFGEEKLDTVEAVAQRWEEIKGVEKMENSRQFSVLSGIPRSQPSLALAMEVSRKVATVGFDWQKEEQVWEKVNEEMAEFRQSLDQNDPDQAAMEFGDLLFSLVNVARFRAIDPEQSLTNMVVKFTRRFQHMEAALLDAGKQAADQGPQELERLWQAAKACELKE